MRHIVLAAATSALLAFAGTNAARADDCSGHDHGTGTAVGAVGGAAIGGLASHSIAGAVVGGVVGGVAGNAIARDQDCEHRTTARADNRDDAYVAGREDQAAHDDRAADADRQQAYQAGREDQADHDADRDANYPR